MNFLGKLLQGIAFVPGIVSGIENVLGAKNGSQKKDAALSFVQSAISVTDAIANKEIMDGGKFSDGLGKIIDGVVQCMNASVWAKRNA